MSWSSPTCNKLFKKSLCFFFFFAVGDTSRNYCLVFEVSKCIEFASLLGGFLRVTGSLKVAYSVKVRIFEVYV